MSDINVLDETTPAGALSGALADSTVTEVKRVIAALRRRGFKITSREPTATMCDALPTTGRHWAAEEWRAMWDAAP